MRPRVPELPDEEELTVAIPDKNFETRAKQAAEAPLEVLYALRERYLEELTRDNLLRLDTLRREIRKREAAGEVPGKWTVEAWVARCLRKERTPEEDAAIRKESSGAYRRREREQAAKGPKKPFIRSAAQEYTRLKLAAMKWGLKLRDPRIDEFGGFLSGIKTRTLAKSGKSYAAIRLVQCNHRWASAFDLSLPLTAVASPLSVLNPRHVTQDEAVSAAMAEIASRLRHIRDLEPRTRDNAVAGELLAAISTGKA